LDIKGKRSVDSFHRELGLLMWDKCGMARSREGLQQALQRVPALREEFWNNLTVPGAGEQFNQELEKAGRVADFLEFGELMCIDALQREESCGGHFRVEHQYTPEDEAAKRGQAGEAKRDDSQFAYVAAWEYTGDTAKPKLHKEPLQYEEVHLAVRSYV
jgi:succinate dehydrogenase / fumarate reductase flavoprotein subunit